MIDILLLRMTEVNKEKVDSFLKRRERGYYLLRKVDAIPVTVLPLLIEKNTKLAFVFFCNDMLIFCNT